MKIAVTFDQGKVFPHFGRTEVFKIYEVEENRVVSGRVIGTDGKGHGALADVLADHQVDVLICGGIGMGAREALERAGITLCSGAEGDADLAVEAWLKGELVTSDEVCDHHHEGSHGCEHHHEGDHCEAQRETAGTGRNRGKTCRVHYRGTFNDGTQFDSSYDRGEPLEFICGAGMMIPGFDAAVADMEPGQIVDIHLMPEEAYGMPDPRAVFTMDVSGMPGADTLRLGQQVLLSGAGGRQFPATVTAIVGSMVTFDANHEMAGKELNFRIELVEVKN